MKTARYFFSDLNDGVVFFATAAERDAAVAKVLAAYRDDSMEENGWPDDVFSLWCGVMTHQAQETHRLDRPDDVDEAGYDADGNYWDTTYDYRCDVELLPLPPEEPS